MKPRGHATGPNANHTRPTGQSTASSARDKTSRKKQWPKFIGRKDSHLIAEADQVRPAAALIPPNDLTDEDAGIEVGGRYSIRELERRIDLNDGKAYVWEEFCEYYTRRRGWFVYQARAFWDSLEIARSHFQVRPLAKGGSASGIESWPNCNSTASPFWDTTKRVYQQKTVRKHG